MNRRNLYKALFVLLVLLWSISELYPPTSRSLIAEFEKRASNPDAVFKGILERAQILQKANPERAFGNLIEAVGTNQLTRYFPYIKVNSEQDPNRTILQALQASAAGQIKLGLDLRGGTSFLVAMDTNRIGADVDRERILAQAVEVLRKRVDKLGVAEPLIQPQGSDRILIQLPGLSEADNDSARRQIQKAAFLEFRMVHPESDELVKQGIPAAGYERMIERQRKESQVQGERVLLVKKKPERGLTGKNIKRAMMIRNYITGEPEINFELDNEGGRLFAEVTRENIGQRLAIILDGELYSAPVIQGEIPSGRGQITGSFTDQEALELANVLENPLEAPVKIVEERRVDPSLGKDSIRSGITASIIGTVAVAVFMLVYYLFSGLLANVAMLLNITILLGVMCSIDTTLTIPGIAGIVLTIGMAVDANVLIYERIREEAALGKSIRGSISAGYDKAFGTIFDTNLTTLIASVILIFMGTGPVKGFGVTLTIGLCVSMFTALVVTRILFDWLLDKGWITGLRMLHLIREPKIDFISFAKPAFALSWTLIIIGCGYGFYRGKDVLGVDFAGGDNLSLRFSQKVEVEKIRQAVEEAGVKEAMIQYQKDLVTGVENLRLTVPFETGIQVEDGLRQKFPEARFERLQLDKVGPVVGREIMKTAIVASLLALFGILIYVAMRYEFSFAVGGVVSIIHDILMTIGWFCLTGRQFNAPMVAAILTIIGFSINDTIVIFDRIREDLKLGIRGTFREVMNKAMNQTLSRTIITSGTVFLATLSLYLFGGGVINDFAFTFLVGILTGTYSSIYIASALVLWWHKGERPQIGAASQVALETETAAAKS
jgi:SecD/SecF fusion protein